VARRQCHELATRLARLRIEVLALESTGIYFQGLASSSARYR
jgi:hypothetical protein